MILTAVRRRRCSWSACAVGCALTVSLAACGGSDESAAPSGPSLVATTSVWSDVVSNVACGEEVATVIPAGSDPHSFEPSLRDRELLEQAEVVVSNGGGLEGSLVDLLTTATGDGEGADAVEQVEMMSHIDPLIGDDPHVWQDPVRVSGAIDAVADAVIAAGRDETRIRECAADYRQQLAALDTEIVGLFTDVTPEQRLLVTNHDAFAYFADRYDFDVIGTVIPSSSTLGESSAGQLADLASLIEQHQVPAIFSERFGSANEARALADRLGVEVVELDSDALAETGPASTYIGLVRANAEAIAAALSPS